MPSLTDDDLDKIAKQNLAAQDSSVATVNAAARLATLPGVGAYGSTPETDQTNLNLAAAMSRSDLGHRFGFGSPQYQQNTETPELPQPQPAQIDIDAVNQRRNAIIQGIDPDAPALVPNAKRRAALYDELGTLTSVAHAHAMQQASTEHQDFLQQRNIDTANQFANFVGGLKNSQYPIGTPEHLAELSDLVAENPLGVSTAAGRQILKTHTQIHHDVAGLQQAVEDYRTATGLEPESIETTATGGVNIRGRTARSTVPTSIASRYARLQAAVSGHEELSKKEEEENRAAGKANVPYSQAEKYHRDQRELALLEDRFPSLSPTAQVPETQPQVAPKTEIISRGGHRYEVDHVNKKVLRQLD